MFKQSNKTLKVLRLADNPHLTGDLAFLSECDSLEELRLDRTSLTGTMTLSAPRLQFASARQTGVSSAIINSMAPQSYLDLSSSSLSAITVLYPQLQTLNISNARLTNIELSRALAGLEHLDLANNSLRELPYDLSGNYGLKMLNVSSNRIQGNFPESISSSLIHLEISNNSFTGAVRTDNWSSAMQTIHLHSNLFSGELPSFSKFSDLQILQLQDNRFIGTLNINTNNLVTLKAQNNAIESIVGDWQPGDPLQVIDISNNLISINLTSFFVLPHLTSVRMHNNRLSGPLAFSSPMPDIAELRLSNNRLNGSLNWPAHSSANIAELHLDNNRFTGQISPAFSQMVGLERLNLSRNSFEGSLPDMSKYFKLAQLDLSSNSIGGSLPEFDYRVPLEAVNLADNRFTGNFPTSWSKFNTTFTYLNLSRNSLSGALWNTLFLDLAHLTVLDLSYNQLSGTLSKTISGHLDLDTLLLQNNSLSRYLPSWTGLISTVNVAYNSFATRIPDLNGTKSLTANGNRLDLCASIPAMIQPLTFWYVFTFNNLTSN